ncbi:hypothetical protein [Stenotrophomonas rhizophila]|uniref:DUF2786 domain-containing protein n=1 Tax=Stenotrophomonas rhizophila TaxID=216778 RepID=A0AAW5PLE2_9GAMM|nr:hypothetical protein [Stenotrophomonas rhizophila]MCS4280530.1 hypothetical protein [Stenotrophomonas rhizophila]
MSAVIIPFPTRSRAPAWPDGQLGIELERLAVLLQEAGNRQPGHSVTLAKAREAALAAYHLHREVCSQRAKP